MTRLVFLIRREGNGSLFIARELTFHEYGSKGFYSTLIYNIHRQYLASQWHTREDTPNIEEFHLALHPAEDDDDDDDSIISLVRCRERFLI